MILRFLKMLLPIWSKHNFTYYILILMVGLLCRTMEIEAQYTVNPSRVSEITMVEDPTTTSGLSVSALQYKLILVM